MSTYGDDPSQPTPASQQPPPPVPPVPPPPAGEQVSFGDGAPAGHAAPAPNRRRRWAIAGGVGAAVLLVAGGAAVWAVSSFLSGGGAQPDSVVPSNAVAFVRVDLDPSAADKIDAYRFLRRFPSVDAGSGEGDLAGQVVKTLLKSDTSVDYDKDVKPWIGKRFGAAAVPGASGDAKPQSLVVIQVSDEGKARTSLRKLLDESAADDASASAFSSPAPSGFEDLITEDAGDDGDDATPQGLVVRDGWALIGPDQASTEAMSDAAKKASLADNATFTSDLAASGGNHGIATAWADLDAAADALTSGDPTGGLLGTTITGKGGRLVATTRITGNAVEISARQFGGTRDTVTYTGSGGQLLQKLPADTTAAFAVGDADKIVDQALQALTQAGSSGGTDILGQLEQATGLDVGTDLKKLVGTGFAVVVGDVSTGEPQVAVRVQTTDPAGSRAVLDEAVTAIEGESAGLVELPDVADVRASDGIVYAMTPAYAQLVAGAGTLGQNPDFLAALPNAAAASSAGYLNFGRIAAQVDDPEAKKNLEELRSLGYSIERSPSETRTTVRLVAR